MVGPRRFLVVFLSGVFVLSACSPAAAPAVTSPPVATTPPATPAPPTPTAAPTAAPTATPTLPPTPLPTLTLAPTVSPPPTPSPLPTPEPVTTVTSADGVLSVEIPDGALAPGVTVSIEARTAAQAPAELKEAGVAHAHYALLPSGTTFAEPVKVSETFPLSTYGSAESVPILFLASRSEGGQWEWLQDLTMTVTQDSIISSGTTDHFSSFFLWSDRTDLIIKPTAPRTDKVGDTFDREIRASSLDQRKNPLRFFDVTFTNPNEDIILVDPGDDQNDPEILRTWECLSVGSYDVQLMAGVGHFAEDNPFWQKSLKLPVTLGAVAIQLPGMCVNEIAKVDVENVCILVHHDPFESFLSWLEFLMWLGDADDGDWIEVIIQGANDDKAVRLTLSTEGGWRGPFGINTAGKKKILKVLVHFADGQTVDATERVTTLLGDFDVSRPPEERTIGICKDS